MAELREVMGTDDSKNGVKLTKKLATKRLKKKMLEDDRLVLEYITNQANPCDVSKIELPVNRLYFALKRLRGKGLIDSVINAKTIAGGATLPLYFVKEEK